MDLIEKLCPFCEQFFDQESIKDHMAVEHLNLESGQFIAESLVEETTPVSPQELEDNMMTLLLSISHIRAKFVKSNLYLNDLSNFIQSLFIANPKRMTLKKSKNLMMKSKKWIK